MFLYIGESITNMDYKKLQNQLQKSITKNLLYRRVNYKYGIMAILIV